MADRMLHDELVEPTLVPIDPGDPETAKALKDFQAGALANNLANLKGSLQFIDQSFGWLRIAYSGMLFFGFVALLAAVGKGIFADSGSQVAGAAVLGGVSVGTFISAFIVKPTDSMERNSVFVPWMLLVLNTYWTRLLYMDDKDKIEGELKDAGSLANEQFKEIAEALAKAQGGDREFIEKFSKGDPGTGTDTDADKDNDGAGGS